MRRMDFTELITRFHTPIADRRGTGTYEIPSADQRAYSARPRADKDAIANLERLQRERPLRPPVKRSCKSYTASEVKIFFNGVEMVGVTECSFERISP